MNSQTFDRYSYCLNNPLVYSDTSGYYSDYSSGGNGGYYINDIPVSQFIFNAWFNFNLLNPDIRFEGYGSVISQYTEILNEARSFHRNYELMQRFLSNPVMAEKYFEYMNETNGHAKLESGNSYDEYLPKNNSNENYYPSYNPSLFYVHGNDDPPNNQGGNQSNGISLSGEKTLLNYRYMDMMGNFYNFKYSLTGSTDPNALAKFKVNNPTAMSLNYKGFSYIFTQNNLGFYFSYNITNNVSFTSGYSLNGVQFSSSLNNGNFVGSLNVEFTPNIKGLFLAGGVFLGVSVMVAEPMTILEVAPLLGKLLQLSFP